jgi:uncharacterized repeat protein (TIGR01451 family)
MNIFVKARSVGIAAVLGATLVLGSVAVAMVAPAQAAITCSASPQPGVDYFGCNLAGANFSGADLSGADFQGATVTGANLQDATLTDTILTGANFTGSDFTDADLAGSYGPRADFTNAIFTGTDLNGDTFTSANFSGATFSGATFSGTILQAADLAGAELSGADLAGVSGQATGTPASLPVGWTFFNGYLIGAGADLRRAALSGDNMPGINLSGAIVTEAKFTGDDLTGAIFTGATVEDTGFEDANLTDADLSDDNLDGSNLTGADLSGTDFVDANLQNATFTGTTGDATTDVTGVTWLDTTCPDGTNSNEDDDTCLGHGFFSPLLLTKSTTSTGYSAAGQTIHYSYLVTNSGTLTMTGVGVSDDLVPTVSCPSGTLAPGVPETCTGTYTVTQGDVNAGSVTNIATASASDSEGLVTSAPSSVTVQASSANSSISLTKSTTSTGYGAAGQTIPYSYLVTNTGTTTLTGVGVSDDLVPTVSCPSGTLAPGVPETCTGNYTVTQGDVDAGSVTNIATAAGTDPQSTVVTSSPSSVTVAANSATSSISLTKSTTSTGYGAAGQTIPYSYLVTNTGTTTLTGVGVSDDLVSTVSCPSGTLSPGVPETCTGTYTVTQGDVDAGSVTNIATASATNPQSLVIASSPSSVTVAAANCNPPAITSAPSATAVVGTAFHFTVTTCSTAVPRIRAFDLPQGLRLVDNHNGTATISGTPWVKDLSQQSATIRAIVKGQTKANQVIVFTLDQAPIFKSNPKYLATTGVTFAYPITTAYGYPVPTITSSALPGGVNLTDNQNGTASLTGTPGPTAGGVYPITITATNGVGSPVNQAFVLTVDQAPVITSTASDTIAAGVLMAPFAVTATGYPAPTLRASGLPSGVRLDTGTIEGTPNARASGTYAVTITATSKAGTTTQNFGLTVTP